MALVEKVGFEEGNWKHYTSSSRSVQIILGSMSTKKLYLYAEYGGKLMKL